MNDYIKSLTGLTDNLITFDPRVAEDDRLKIISANPTARHPFARQEHCELYLRQSYCQGRLKIVILWRFKNV